MKSYHFICFLIIVFLGTLSETEIFAQALELRKMDIKTVQTKVGMITTYVREVQSEKTPLIFLHGVYFDHHLWDFQAEKITDRTVITVDMPLHGTSKNITPNWTLADCGEMLVEILDSLHIQKVIAIGHSWGSMTILRASAQYPERFQAVGFCNMPYEASSEKQQKQFRFQHNFLTFRNFYAKQVAKALYGKKTLQENPELLHYLKNSIGKLTKEEVKTTDYAVIINADDATDKLKNLTVPAMALKGVEDYVPTPAMEVKIIEGGHVSPIEKPKAVQDFVQQLLDRYAP